MKLLPTPPKDVRAKSDDALGHGMDAVITLMLFFGAGFGIDRLAGTTPLFMIVLRIVGAVGIFARFYYSYEQRMQDLEAERAAMLRGTASTDDARDAADVSTNGEAA